MSISLQEESNKVANYLTNPKLAPKRGNQYILKNKDNYNNYTIGDIIYENDTNRLYIKLDSGLTTIDNKVDIYSHDNIRYRELDNQVLRCKSCNSVIDPSKVDSNNNVTCPYCNSVNHIFEKR